MWFIQELRVTYALIRDTSTQCDNKISTKLHNKNCRKINVIIRLLDYHNFFDIFRMVDNSHPYVHIYSFYTEIFDTCTFFLCFFLYKLKEYIKRKKHVHVKITLVISITGCSGSWDVGTNYSSFFYDVPTRFGRSIFSRHSTHAQPAWKHVLLVCSTRPSLENGRFLKLQFGNLEMWYIRNLEKWYILSRSIL